MRKNRQGWAGNGGDIVTKKLLFKDLIWLCWVLIALWAFFVVHGLLTAVTCLVAEHRL